MTDAWILTLAPVVGLAGDALVQIVCAHLSRRVGISILAGAFAGLLITAAVTARESPPAGSTGDVPAVYATALLTYLALAFGYWAFLNLNITSLRIRMLREILHSPGGISETELMARYSQREFLLRRLDRLKNSGQLSLRDDRWRLESPTLLPLARTLAAIRALLLP